MCTILKMEKESYHIYMLESIIAESETREEMNESHLRKQPLKSTYEGMKKRIPQLHQLLEKLILIQWATIGKSPVFQAEFQITAANPMQSNHLRGNRKLLSNINNKVQQELQRRIIYANITHERTTPVCRLGALNTGSLAGVTAWEVCRAFKQLPQRSGSLGVGFGPLQSGLAFLSPSAS